MNDEKKHIDQLLNQAFAGFEPAVPPTAWNNIEQGLNKKKRRFIFWWSAAALLILTGSALSVYLFSSKSKPESTLINEQKSISIPKISDGNQVSNTPEQNLNNGSSASDDSKSTENKKVTTNKNSIASATPKEIVKVERIAIEPNKESAIEIEKLSLLPKLAFVNLASLTFDPNLTVDFKKSPLKSLKYESKWQVGAFVSSGVGFRALGVNSDFANYVNKNYLQIRKDGETGRMSNNFGLTISRKLNSILSIESGFNLTQTGFSQNYNYKINEVAVPDETKPMIQGSFPIIGYLTLTNPKAVSLKSNSNFMYLGLPLMLRTTIYNHKSNSVQVLAGPALNILLQQRGQTINLNNLELSNNQKASDYNTLSINGRFAIRYNKALSPFFNFGLEAGYSRFLQNQFKGQTAINQKPYQSGVNAMLTYNIYKTVIHKKD